MAICEQCGKEHDGTFGSGRFCGRSCSNKWVALNQSDEAKARKVEKGKKNLTKGWKLTKEQNTLYARKGAEARAATMKSRRKEWLDAVLAGLLDPYNGGYCKLTARLIEFGLKENKCECCGLSRWLDKDIPLELHHKDGDNQNNSLDNLELLCPNCHALTPNYSWRKLYSKESISEDDYDA